MKKHGAKMSIYCLGKGVAIILTNDEAKALVRGCRHLIAWNEMGNDDADFVHDFISDLGQSLADSGIKS